MEAESFEAAVENGLARPRDWDGIVAEARVRASRGRSDEEEIASALRQEILREVADSGGVRLSATGASAAAGRGATLRMVSVEGQQDGIAVVVHPVDRFARLEPLWPSFDGFEWDQVAAAWRIDTTDAAGTPIEADVELEVTLPLPDRWEGGESVAAFVWDFAAGEWGETAAAVRDGLVRLRLDGPGLAVLSSGAAGAEYRQRLRTCSGCWAAMRGASGWKRKSAGGAIWRRSQERRSDRAEADFARR